MRSVGRVILLLVCIGVSTELRAQERTFLSVSWDLAWEIPGAVESPLQLPWALAPLSDGSVVLFDHGDNRVKRFSPPGRLEWSVGGEGQGPGEFIGATDLKVGAKDQIWVLDRDDRVTTLSGSTGELISTSRVSAMHRLLPLPSGGLVTLRDPSGSPLLAVVEEGGTTRDWSPSQFNSRMTAIQREGYIDGFRRAPTALVVFRRSGKLVLLRRTEEGVRGQMTDGIEPLDFPDAVSWSAPNGAIVERPDPRSYEAARWIGHDEDFFYVGFSGENGDRDVVDLYATEDGAYRGSVRLPMEVDNGTVVGNGMIAGLAREPVPHLRVWQIWFNNPKARVP